MKDTNPTSADNGNNIIVIPSTHCKTKRVTKTTVDCLAWNLTNGSLVVTRKNIPVIGPSTYAKAPAVSFLSPKSFSLPYTFHLQFFLHLFTKTHIWSTGIFYKNESKVFIEKKPKNINIKRRTPILNKEGLIGFSSFL